VANKRDTSKQKRARENRAQREALKARTQAASSAPEERRSKAASAASEPTTKKDRAAARATRTRPVRPGDVPVDLDTLEGNWFTKRLAVPGGRQVLTGLLLTILLTGMMLFFKFPSADDPDGPATETLWELLGPAAIAILGIPLLAMGIAAHLTVSPHRRRVWIVASIVVAFEVFLGFTYYLFPAGFLLYALWRQTKVEGPPPSRRSRRDAADDEDPADESDERTADA
jgi:hypothetical protein